ncbi:MAG: lamin tail domain-containing protein [Candidatus Altiarchaeota archaeon]
MKTKTILLMLLLIASTASSTPAGDNVVINEVLYDVDGDEKGEWIELFNPTDQQMDVGGWSLTDQEAILSFPNQTTIESHSYLLVSREAATFKIQNPGITPDFEMRQTDEDIPNLLPISGTYLSLANTGDEVILRNELGTDVDVLVYGTGYYDEEGGGATAQTVSSGKSLERLPQGSDSDNCSFDFQQTDTPTPTPTQQSPPETTTTVPQTSTSTLPVTTTTTTVPKDSTTTTIDETTTTIIDETTSSVPGETTTTTLPIDNPPTPAAEFPTKELPFSLAVLICLLFAAEYTWKKERKKD